MPVNTKLTNRVALEIALSTLPTDKSFTIDATTFSADEVKAKLEAMLAAYEKKAATPKKPTKTQTENAPIKDTLLATLRNSVAPMTIPDLLAAAGLDISTQKASALLRQLRLDGEVVSDPGKGKEKTTFRAVL